ncbi:MAG: sugar ABC transporter ATP-binding protein, partial [Desulfobacterales bacterium]|nr:sugar ABC transporter ATP-binding protein [Desulfobacterales bacterium]
IVGHNGAGKSTLVQILMGGLKPDAGIIYLNGKSVSFSSPREALNQGIAMVWQELDNFQNLSITENIMMGRFIHRKNGTIDWGANHKLCRKYLSRIKVDVEPQTLMGKLALSQQQLVEFAKALSYDPAVLILDEPTSALSFTEEKVLYDTVRAIREQGVAIAYISHRLEEIITLSDRITVLRDGQKVFTKQMADLDKDSIVDAIIGSSKQTRKHQKGKANSNRMKRKDFTGSPVVIDVKNLSKDRHLHDISFSLHLGEFIGITGVFGSGITELGQLLFGILQNYEGTILLDGDPIDYTSPSKAVKAGIGYVPKNRKEEGILPNMSVGDNIILSSLDKICKLGFIDFKKKNGIINSIIDTIDLRPRKPEMPIVSLSGGNQQKVVIARWMSNKSQILIFDEPTRGVDVGAIEKIYDLIRLLTENGVSVIVLSSEIEEIHTEVDRLIVLNKGKIVGEIDTSVDSWKVAFGLAIN